MEDAQFIETPAPEAPKLSESHPTAQFAAVMNSDHWLKAYIVNLLAAHQAPNGVDFKTAEALLNRERETFEAEVAIAMRIFRVYPHLFHHQGAPTTAAA